jgi:hypothetical protein
MTFWYKKPNEPDHWNKKPMIVYKKPETPKVKKDEV